MPRAKPHKRFYVKSKSDNYYTIIADYLKYKHEEDGDVIFFYKTIKNQKNDDGSNDWIVAFIKVEEVAIIGLEDYLFKGMIPMLKGSS